MRRALLIASVASMIEQFNMENINILMNMGFSVDVACNFEEGSTIPSEKVREFKNRLNELGIHTYQVSIPRNPMALAKSWKAYRVIREIVNSNYYDIIHCHSPIGGVLTRLASKETRKKGTKVIYTAHGFHFFDGASLLNWILYYPIERNLMKYTDVLITINKEDYDRAKKMKQSNDSEVKFIPGVGVDVKKYNLQGKLNKIEKRQEFGINLNAFVLISVGELTKRKNHKIVLESLAELKDKNIFYIIVGKGIMEGDLKQLASKLELSNQIIFTGYRNDIRELLYMADCFIFPSLQEGLPVALMEAMACGLPIISSRIRGNTDLIDDNKGGLLVPASEKEAYVRAIDKIKGSKKLWRKYGNYNLKRIRRCDKVTINREMEKTYLSAVSGNIFGQYPNEFESEYSASRE